MVMITICYPPGAGGYFVLSLLQQDPSVCSCADIGLFWKGVSSDHDTWVSMEDANYDHHRTCCDRMRCEMTHHTPDQKGYRGNISGNTDSARSSRRSQRQRLRDMAQNWLIITCTESDRAWLIENERKKPYVITQPNNRQRVMEHFEPTRYQRYSACVHIPFQSLWTHQGITDSIEQISQGFKLTLDHTLSHELAEAWWNTQHKAGIEPPCE